MNYVGDGTNPAPKILNQKTCSANLHPYLPSIAGSMSTLNLPEHSSHKPHLPLLFCSAAISSVEQSAEEPHVSNAGLGEQGVGV